MDTEYDAIILGGGVTGLVAGYRLSKHGKKVLVIEKSPVIGGALSSFRINDYYLEHYYHHIFKRDTFLLKILEELGLSGHVLWEEALIGFLYNRKIFRLTSPFDLLCLKPLTIVEKMLLAKFLIRIILVRNVKKYDSITAKEFILKNAGKGLYSKFFEPLLRQKFDNSRDKVSAAWFIGRLQLRGNRTARGEVLGYLKGGFHKYVQKLKDVIISHGGGIILSSNADNILVKENRIYGIKIRKKTIKCSHVISTIPPDSLNKLVKFDKEYEKRLLRIEYQGAVCVIMGLKKPLSRYYWTNMMDREVCFGAIMEHTNLMPPGDYNMDHIVYLGSYCNRKSDLLKISDKEIFRRYFRDLQKRFKDLSKDDLLWWKVARLHHAGIIYKKNILSDILGFETPIKNLYIGGMFNSYPERGIDLSTKIGDKIAHIILRRGNN